MEEDIEAKGCFGCFSNSEKKNNLPCAKFIIAAGISIASFTIGCVMTITSPTNSAMLPFYTSLITGAISYWVQPPSMNDKH